MREHARTHIASLERLRALTDTIIRRAWLGLPGYDEDNVPEWLTVAVPVIQAAQRQSVALTEAYIARALERPPVGIDPATVIGAAVRAGTPPEVQWRRPFVTVWTALANQTPWEAATAAGLARATEMAAMDVQMASRATLGEIAKRNPAIRGYQRVADSAACQFCRTVDGAFVKSATAMPLHPHCGCTLEPVLSPVDVTPVPEGVAVHEHGELGPVLGDPAHSFTSL